MSARLLLGVVLALGGVALGVIAWPGEPQASATDVERAALQWVGSEIAEPPRRDGDEWEVDIRRADGSIVEVTLGDDLRLRKVDEERAAGGGPASDELVGAARARAIRTALRAHGPGEVGSVERDYDGSTEVNILRPDGTVLEVELDRTGRVVDVDDEDPGDE